MEPSEATPSLRSSVFRNPVVILTGIGFLLSIVGGLFLAFGPVYYRIIEFSDAPDIPITSERLSLIQANGVWVSWLLAVPFVMSGIALALAYTGYTRSGYGKAYLWIAGVTLLTSSAMGILSIGAFYLPTAALLLAAAFVQSRKGNKEAPPLAE